LSIGVVYKLVKLLWTDRSWVGESDGEDLPRSISAFVVAVPARTSVVNWHSHGTETDVHGSEFCPTCHSVRKFRRVTCLFLKCIEREIACRVVAPVEMAVVMSVCDICKLSLGHWLCVTCGLALVVLYYCS